MDTKAEIFLSYCWADETIADGIYDYLVRNNSINLHRDKIDIGTWESIKKYMESIPAMDYVILLISDAYLKSSNCMYEVMEVMRDRSYKEKIFPVIINRGIYNPVIRAGYVVYWQQQYEELHDALKGISIQNLGRLGDDLKRRQDISSNIASFLDLVSDLNNPEIENAGVAIENKLITKCILEQPCKQKERGNDKTDLFETLNIPKVQTNKEISEFDINRFMITGFKEIKELLEELCLQYEADHMEYQFSVEHINSRESLIQYYKNGKKIGGLKLFINDTFGTTAICISNAMHYYSGNTSWNAMYESTIKNGSLGFKSTMSLWGSDELMSTKEVVKDIWMKHIYPYMER